MFWGDLEGAGTGATFKCPAPIGLKIDILCSQKLISLFPLKIINNSPFNLINPNVAPNSPIKIYRLEDSFFYFSYISMGHP